VTAASLLGSTLPSIVWRKSMILRCSQFIHIIRLGPGRALVLHALTHLRLGVDAEVECLIAGFQQPRDVRQALPDLTRQTGYDLETLAGCVASLLERGVLTELGPEEELAKSVSQLAETNGRDPGEMLKRFRRERQEGAMPYWAVSATRGITQFDGRRRRLSMVLLADCDLQMEADFLTQEGNGRGLDLRIFATFPDDVRFVGERPHDLILVGALRSRNTIAWASPQDHDGEPFQHYTSEARRLLEKLRAQSRAPILIDNLPEPTVQPLGLGERGLQGHRNRFRRANLALAQLAEDFADVHVVDVAAALAAVGSECLVDDGLTSFTHFGSPGWMLQRPQSEKAAVHDAFPDMAPLAELVRGDPYRRERVTARAHVDVLVSVMGVERKKCVIVDLDGVLWPGVLAETGSPFAWHPETSGPYSYIGLYFGIHEALKQLKRRGIVLVAVSKNDEAVVRDLWTYPDHYPHDKLLKPDDFVTWRVNWSDKSQNIRQIAQQLGFGLDAFIFIDDHPIERERVRRTLPEIDVWGEELFSLRRRLLSDPRLQLPHVTGEAETRTLLVKAQLSRARLRADTADDSAFLASLNIKCCVERLAAGAPLERVQELFQRTTQFNATGRTFTTAELSLMLACDTGLIFSLKVSDSFGDHGLVGAAVVVAGEIVAFAISCRVMGLGVEQRLLDAIVVELAANHDVLAARIIETSRNLPVRNLYRDRGFKLQQDGFWRLLLRQDRRPTVINARV
jgi:FkbH-like protein